MTTAADGRPSVAIVGGGLAGLAAAVALADDCRVELFEARRTLGGRAGSFRDPATGEMVDHCQHVSMGCCTNLADFCRRVGIETLFRHDRSLHFIGPDGRQCNLEAGPLPPPLHLAGSFLRLGFLSFRERLAIARAMWKLMRLKAVDDSRSPTIGSWLRANGQSPRAIELFWNVVLVSALAEELDRASLAAARKVIIDGFLAHRDAYVVEVPQVPLAELYGRTLKRWLVGRGVRLRLGCAAQRVGCQDRPTLETADGERHQPDYLVLALPWHRLHHVVAEELAAAWPWLAEMAEVPSSPITGVHLWFDRPIMTLDHAVLVGRTSQWIFRRASEPVDGGNAHYYQVVISASRDLAGRSREQIIEEVCSELCAIWPEAHNAKRIAARVVTEQAAVFSTRPGLERIRPPQRTAVPGVLVAGDWTATEWPATMESAVRSGYLAAEAVFDAIGQPRRVLVPDLPRAPLARWLIRS